MVGGHEDGKGVLGVSVFDSVPHGLDLMEMASHIVAWITVQPDRNWRLWHYGISVLSYRDSGRKMPMAAHATRSRVESQVSFIHVSFALAFECTRLLVLCGNPLYLIQAEGSRCRSLGVDGANSHFDLQLFKDAAQLGIGQPNAVIT